MCALYYTCSCTWQGWVGQVYLMPPREMGAAGKVVWRGCEKTKINNGRPQKGRGGRHHGHANFVHLSRFVRRFFLTSVYRQFRRRRLLLLLPSTSFRLNGGRLVTGGNCPLARSRGVAASHGCRAARGGGYGVAGVAAAIVRLGHSRIL